MKRITRHPYWATAGAVAVLAVGPVLSITPLATAASTTAASSSSSAASPSASSQATTTTAGGYAPSYGSANSDPWGRSSGSGQQGQSGQQWPSGQTQTTAVSGTTVKSAPGVVLIDTVLTSGEAAGTGMVIGSDGLVLTNYHVVEGSTLIRVTVADSGTTYSAKVLGFDATADIALLQLSNAKNLTTVTLDSDGVSLGDTVKAVGNGGGQDVLYAVTGVLTDTSDTIQVSDEQYSNVTHTLKNLLVTDADVVPGYSGGPLYDAQGQVVGITTAASTGQSIDGYAVPIATAMKVVRQIEAGTESGTVRVGPRAALGVQLSSSTTASGGYGYGGYGANGRWSSGSSGSSATSGATVGQVVTGSAADAAGLAAGDVITKVGSTTITDAETLSTVISAHNPGDKVSITWSDTAGTTHVKTVTLGTSTIA